MSLKYSVSLIPLATGSSDGVFVGVLVGYQYNSTITSWYTSGDANGGAGNGYNAGDLPGIQSVDITTSSYANGVADSGTGSDGRVGGLGYQFEGSDNSSYGFGTVSNGIIGNGVTRSDDAFNSADVPNVCAITQVNSDADTITSDESWLDANRDFGVTATPVDERLVVKDASDTIIGGQDDRTCN